MATSPIGVAIGAGLALLGGLFVLLGGALVFSGAQKYRLTRRIGAASGAASGWTDAGHVTLEGTAAEHEETLQAPVTGKPCLGYEYGVDRYDPDRESTSSDEPWNRFLSGERVVPFLLETDSGTVLVRPGDATVEIEDDEHQLAVSADEDPRSEVRSFFESGQYPRNWSLGSYLHDPTSAGEPRRYTETRLEAGETAFVSGVAHPPSEAGHLPAGVDAVVGVPDGAGTGGIRGRLSLPGAVVGDRPIDDAVDDFRTEATRYLIAGLFAVGLAGVLVYNVAF